MSEKKRPPNGRPVSTPMRKGSANNVATKSTQLRRLLASIYSDCQKLDDAAANKACRQDFVFHMSDWEADLRALAELYDQPDRFSKSEAKRIVAGFLYHATAHIMEAARLMLDYEPGYLFDSPKLQRHKL